MRLQGAPAGGAQNEAKTPGVFLLEKTSVFLNSNQKYSRKLVFLGGVKMHFRLCIARKILEKTSVFRNLELNLAPKRTLFGFPEAKMVELSQYCS